MTRFLTTVRFRRSLIIFCLLATLSLVFACGGGGGGGGDGSSGGNAGPAMVIMSTGSFNFTAARNAPRPESQSAVLTAMGVDKLELRAAYGAKPQWLDADFEHSASTPNLTMGIMDTNLPPGTYTARLQLVAIEANILGDRVMGHQDITVTYQVVSISVSSSEMLFRMVEGGSQLPDAQVITIFGDAVNWQASSDVDWFDISPSSGNPVAGNITITVNADAMGLSTGLHTGTVSISAGGGARPVTVTLQIDQRRISAVHNGMALSSLPSGQRLTQTTTIIDNAGDSGAWTASGDAGWLQLDPVTGNSGDILTVTADPAGLDNGIYYASVTVAPQNATGNILDDTIRVALYVSDQAADPETTVSRPMKFNPNQTAADPIRPYLYVIDYDGLVARIGGYHVYTGEALPLLDPDIQAGRDIKSMIVGSDGSHLFVVHSDGYDESDQGVVTMDLDTGGIVTSVPITDQGVVRQCKGACDLEDFTRVIYARQDGTEALITNHLEVIDPQTGHKLIQFEPELGDIMFNDFTRPFVRISPDGKNLYYQGRDGYAADPDYLLFRFGLTFSGISGTAPIVEELDALTVNGGGAQSQLVINRNGDKVCSLGQSVACYDADLNPVQAITPTAERGLPVTGIFDFRDDLYVGYDTYPAWSAIDIDVYDGSMTLVDTHDQHGYLDGMSLTGDGRRMVAIENNGYQISFVDVD